MGGIFDEDLENARWMNQKESEGKRKERRGREEEGWTTMRRLKKRGGTHFFSPYSSLGSQAQSRFKGGGNIQGREGSTLNSKYDKLQDSKDAKVSQI